MRLIIALLICSVPIGSIAQSSWPGKQSITLGTVQTSMQLSSRKQEMDAIGKNLEEQREEQGKARRKYENRVAEARREVAEAERNLATTRQSKHNATPERIALAEQRLQLARRRLREVQSTAP